MKKRIVVITRAYPSSSHSYLNNDIEYLDNHAEVLVLSPNRPSSPYYSKIQFNYFDNFGQLEALSREFKPDLIISWMLPNHVFARYLAEKHDIPFILKIHTPDVFRFKTGRSRLINEIKAKIYGEEYLSRSYAISMSSLAKTARSPNLQAVFAIPAFRNLLEAHFPADKLMDLTPWFFFERYFNDQPNGDKLLVQGSLVSRREKQTTFGEILGKINAEIDWIVVPTPGCLWLDIPGIPANVKVGKYVPPSDMPALYKKYRAMIVIGRGKYSRGLPMSVLEAQASGVTVIAPSLRPDFDRFVTEGGGFIFTSETEIPKILESLPDEEKRKMGFSHAKQFGPENFQRELNLAGIDLSK